MKLLAILCVLIATVAAEPMRFDNNRVYSLKVTNQEQLDWLHQLETEGDGYLFWNSIAMGRDVDLMVPPYKLAEFDEMTAKFGISHEIKIEDVQTLIDNERPKQLSKADRAFDWTDYMTYTEIYDWLDEQLITYPTLLTNITIGTTYEGRTIRAVKLSYRANNPAVFIESNIHAREWITSATATWWLNELLTSTDPEIVDLAQTIDWYIIPIYNVDGFAYSHTVNRLWRKNRQPHAHLCYGTDVNRNFDFNWMVNNGASDNPCSETFAGPEPFSEPEAVALADFLSEHSSEIRIYISFHSYGQYVIYPYGHSLVESPPNRADLTIIGNSAGAAFATRFNTDYIVGNNYEALRYYASGGSVDWAFEIENIRTAFTFEFRDRRNGNFGFVLPANQIIPNALETRDALVALVAQTRTLNLI